MAGSVFGQLSSFKLTAIQCDNTEGRLLIEFSNPITNPVTATVRQGVNTLDAYTIPTGSMSFQTDLFPSSITLYTVSISGFNNASVIISEEFEKVYVTKVTDIYVDCPDKGKFIVNADGGIKPYTYYAKWGDNPEDEKFVESPSGNPSTIYGLDRGKTYQVYVVDVNGCKSDFFPNVTFPNYDILTADINKDYPKDATCKGKNDGKVLIDAGGGSPPFQYDLWLINTDTDKEEWIPNIPDDGMFTNLKPALDPYYYSVTVTDVYNCSVNTKLFEIDEPDTPNGYIYPERNINPCYGEANGSFVVIGNYGTPGSGVFPEINGYQFDILSIGKKEFATKPEYTATFSDMPAGEYIITGKDGNGCIMDIYQYEYIYGGSVPYPVLKPNVTLVDKAPIEFTIVEPITLITCAGLDDAAIEIINTSDTYQDEDMMYQLLKKNNNDDDYEPVGGWQVAPLFENLSPGTYKISGKADGCNWTNPTPIVIEDLNPVKVNPATSHPSACNNGDDGSIDGLDATGGNGGNYEFSISDDNGTTWSKWWKEGDPDPNPFYGLNGGATYLIKAKDVKGCESPTDKQLIITIPDPPEVKFDANNADPECALTATGTITISKPSYPNDGHDDWKSLQLEYQLEGDNGIVITWQPQTSFRNLPKGTYTITGRIADRDDGKGCDWTTDVTLKDPNPVAISFVGDPVNVSCFNGSNGSVNVSINGGISEPTGNNRTQYRSRYGYSYHYQIDEDTWSSWTAFTGWATAPNSITIGSLPAGDYEIKGKQRFEQRTRNGNGNGGWSNWAPVPDSDLCESVIIKVTITQPDPLIIFVKDTVTTCPTSTDGVIIVSAEGGTSPYQFRRNPSGGGGWSAWNASTSFPSLAPNTYSFQVRDANQCRFVTSNVNLHQPDSQKSATVSAATAINLNQPLTILQDPNDPITCNTDVDLTVNITGRQRYRDLEFLLLKNGVPVNTEWLSEEDFTDDGFTVLASNIQISDSYQIRVRYAAPYNAAPNNGCPVTTVAKTIVIPAPITISLKDSTSILCHNGTNGTIWVEASGGYQATGAKYMFKVASSPVSNERSTDWLYSNVSVFPELYQLRNVGPDTTFIFTVKRVYGSPEADACDEAVLPSISKRLANPDKLELTLDFPADKTFHIDCPKEGNSKIETSAQGGTGAYLFSLYTFDFDKNEYKPDPFRLPQASGLFAGLDSSTYKVKVADVNLCGDSISDIIITRPKSIKFDVTPLSVTLPCADSIASIRITLHTTNNPLEKGPYVYRLINEVTQHEYDWKDYLNTVADTVRVGVGKYRIEMAYCNTTERCSNTESCSNHDSSDVIELDVAQNLKVLIDTYKPNDCYGAHEGEITFTSNLPVNAGYVLLYSEDGVKPYLPCTWGVFNKSTFTYSELFGGFYQIKAILGTCCTYFSDSVVELRDPALITGTFAVTNAITCNGDSDGELTLTVSGGKNTDYVYEWYQDGSQMSSPVTSSLVDGKGVSIASDLSVGNYWVLVSLLDNGNPICETRIFSLESDPNFFNLPEPLAIKVKAASEDATCPNIYLPDGTPQEIIPNGAIRVNTVLNVQGDYQLELLKFDYNIIPNEYVDTYENDVLGVFSSLDSGKYLVRITDDKGCKKDTADIVIKRPESIDFTAAPISATLACDNAATSITVALDSNMDITKSYVYRLFKEDDTPVSSWIDYVVPGINSIPNIGKGVYYVLMAYDGHTEDCTIHSRIDIEIIVIDNEKFEAVGQSPACNNGTTGTIFVNTTLYPRAEITLWQLNPETNQYEQRTDRTYNTTHSDFIGKPNITGGFRLLRPGDYEVRSLLDNACSYVAQIELQNPDPLMVTLLTSIEPCGNNNNSKGTIILKATGGVPGPGDSYIYNLWIPGSPNYESIDESYDGVFTDLDMDRYWFTVRDFNAPNYCQTDYLSPEGATLIYPEELKAYFDRDAGDVTDLNCFGDDDGKAIVTVEGGRKRRIYEWKEETSSFVLKEEVREKCTYYWEKFDEDLNDWNPWIDFKDSLAFNMTSGTYRVTVTDACGTKKDAKLILSQPDALNIALDAENTKGYITCDGDPAGYITVKTTGGTPFEDEPTLYKYLSYTLTQKDEYDNFTIDISVNPEFSVETIEDDEIFEIFKITGLEGGEYKLVIEVTDDNGCTNTLTEEIELINPKKFNPTINAKDVNCHDDTDGGSIIVTVEGGLAPYTITVNGNSIDRTVTFDPTDGDQEEEFWDIEVVDELTTVTLKNIPGGDDINPTKRYTVVVKEERENGCEQTKTVSISTPAEFKLVLSLAQSDQELLEEVYICPGNTHRLFIRSEGGTWRYLISDLHLNNQPVTNPYFDFNNAPAGEYYFLDAKNEKGCSAEQSNTVKIIEYKPLDVNMIIPTPVTCDKEGSITLMNPVGGKGDDKDEFVYSLYIKNGDNWDENSDFVQISNYGQDEKLLNDSITKLKAGDYYILMSHKNIHETCLTDKRIPLETANPNFITVSKISTIDLNDHWFETTDPKCFTDYGKIKIFNPIIGKSKNILFRIYDQNDKDVVWLALSNGAAETEFNILPVGKYFMDIEDKDNGCKTEDVTFEIGKDMPKGEIKNISETLQDYDCTTKSGYIEFDVYWDGDETPVVICTHTANESTPLAGEKDGDKWHYKAVLITGGIAHITVSVTDHGNYCSFDAPTNDYTFPNDITLSSTSGNGACDDPSVEVTFTITGGTGPYTLSIGANDIPIGNVTEYTDPMEAGSYNVKVTDNMGCFAEINDLQIVIRKSVNLSSVTPPSIIQESCKDKANGSFEFKVDEGYTYVWDKNGTPVGGPSLTDVSEGKYKVKIYNTDNCPTETEYEMTIANKIEVSIAGDGNGDDYNEYCPDGPVLLTGVVLINDAPFTTGDALWILPDKSRLDFNPAQPTLQLSASDGTVKLESYLGICSSVAEFEIKTAPLPTIEFPKDAIYIPEGAVFDLNVNADNFTEWAWSADPDFGQTEGLGSPPNSGILYSPREHYELTLTLKNKYGCEYFKSISVDQPLLFVIPNAFTPNGDGINELWTFRNIDQYTDIYDVQVAVFNRGGSQIWEGKGYNNSSVVWDGRRNGQDVPIGVYWYVVKLVPKSGTGETITRTGSVTVIR